MHKALSSIPERILDQAIGALCQANMHAVFMDPSTMHWDAISVLNAAHAGELFIKAIIAKEHPLLIFKDLFGLDDGRSDEIEIEDLIKRGKTHDFEKLPQILWAITGERIPNRACWEKLRTTRNAIQHFCAPAGNYFKPISKEFIYTVIDPLIQKHFDLYAIEYHEDHVGYDYIVAALIKDGLKFSIPPDFSVGEVNITEEVQDASDEYKSWLRSELAKLGQGHLVP